MKRRPNQLPASLKNVNVKQALRRMGIYEQLAENKQLKESFIPIIKNATTKAPAPIVKSNNQTTFSDEQIKEYCEKKIHTIQVFEDKFKNTINQFIHYVVKGFLRNLDAELGTRKSFIAFTKKDYFSDNEADFLTKAQIDFTPLLDNLAVIAGNDAYKLINIKEPYILNEYRKKIEKNVEKFTKSMLDTDREHLVNIITQGLEDGKSNIDIRNAIEADFSDYSLNQAQRITLTEVARVSNQASMDAYQQSGVVEGLQWIIFGADDECADYDGEVRYADDSSSGYADFYDAQNEFQDGDPPLHPNCKCQLIPIIIGTDPTYQPDSKSLRLKIRELEAKIDKRTKAYKEMKAERLDDKAYIKSLESYLGVDNES